MYFSTPAIFSAHLSRRVENHVHMIVRQDEAAGVVIRRYVERDRAHAVRQDGGHEAATPGQDDLESRMGSPATIGERTIAPTNSLIASGRSLFLTRAELADAAGQVCQPRSPSLITCPVLRSALATRTSVVASGGGGGGGAGAGVRLPLASMAAIPPAASAMTKTMMRERLIFL